MPAARYASLVSLLPRLPFELPSARQDSRHGGMVESLHRNTGAGIATPCRGAPS
ncbi:hypothetical protein D9X30_1306 [Cupriavidus sp. U2]|nr:hypothetical protein D9X30_1306 [Cupriavidus sp. U2]